MFDRHGRDDPTASFHDALHLEAKELLLRLRHGELIGAFIFVVVHRRTVAMRWLRAFASRLQQASPESRPGPTGSQPVADSRNVRRTRRSRDHDWHKERRRNGTDNGHRTARLRDPDERDFALTDRHFERCGINELETHSPHANVLRSHDLDAIGHERIALSRNTFQCPAPISTLLSAATHFTSPEAKNRVIRLSVAPARNRQTSAPATASPWRTTSKRAARKSNAKSTTKAMAKKRMSYVLNSHASFLNTRSTRSIICEMSFFACAAEKNADSSCDGGR